MNADEIVRILRGLQGDGMFNLYKGGDSPALITSATLNAAADLIENQAAKIESLTAQLAEKDLELDKAIERWNLSHKNYLATKKQLSASQARELAAVEAIRESLSDTGNQRPHLNRCSQCAKFITDSRQRKYKYGCTSLCGDALKVMAACGFKNCEPLIPFADEWRGPRAGDGQNG